MFYSEAILSRRGPLAKVWLAAHWERKLSKTQTLQTDINKSVDAIMGDEVEVMALRLTGQLLLGVVRIYSRKAKYLLDDCNEALLKIKMAFRPGVVDMTEDQLAVPKNAITLQDGGLDLDLLLPDANWDMDFEDRPQGQGQHVARAADITLQHGGGLDLEFDDLGYGFGLGAGDGIGSQDIDLGLDFGEGAGPNRTDDDISVEMGRDARGHSRLSVNSALVGKPGEHDLDILSRLSREASEHPPPMDGFVFGGDLDLGLDFGDVGPSDREKTPGQARTPSRASSPLTPLPVTPPEGTPKAVQPTPKKQSTKKKQQPKKQIVDSVIELEDGPGPKTKSNGDLGTQPHDVSDILVDQHFLPSSRTVMRLLEIRADPLAYFLPTKVTPEGTFLFAGPPGLAPELEQFFMLPAKNFSSKRRGASPAGRATKKRRVEEEDVELARRDPASRAASVALASDIMAGTTGEGLQFDPPQFDDIPMDLDFDVDAGGMPLRADETHVSTPAADGEIPDFDEGAAYADLSCPIGIFDTKQATQEEHEAVDDGDKGQGFSKNTVRAFGIVRKELHSPSEDRTLSFEKMAEKATRRAAASFFFELLVLSTRDCIKVSQPGPFENIEIQGKPKLWERQQRPFQRHGSAAPSIATSLGL